MHKTAKTKKSYLIKDFKSLNHSDKIREKIWFLLAKNKHRNFQKQKKILLIY